MREIRLSGSEGGVGQSNAPSLPLSVWTPAAFDGLAHIRRHRGQKTEFVIDEQRRNVTGWMNYFGISHAYAAVLEVDEWSLDDHVAFFRVQTGQFRAANAHLRSLTPTKT